MNIKDVASHLDVSPSTVSRVLNDHPDVSDAMRDRVMEAARELGYQPDFLAQSLRGGFTRTIGFVLRDLSNPIFADIVKGAETTLRDAGHALILANSEGDPDLDVRNVRILDQRRVDGMLLSLQSESREDLRRTVEELEIPIVLIDRDIPHADAGAVFCDHRSGVLAATDHLLELGHRRVAFISGPRDIRATRERLAGYQEAFRKRGLEEDDHLVRLGSYAREFGHAETLGLMAQRDRPTAVVSAGVQGTAGVLAACRELGLALGRDYSLVSCDEIDFMSFVDPPISVVRRDAALIGRMAGELLLEMVVGGEGARQVVLPTDYVPRGSSANPPSST
ncbi:MAG: LacI family DNA-binding transcriptional regulator [Acidimicrobiales bacterium]